MSKITNALSLVLVLGTTVLVGCEPKVEPAQCRYQVDPGAKPYVDPETDQLIQPETYWGPCTQGEGQEEEEPGVKDLPECDHLVNPHFAEPGVDCKEETTEE